MRFGRRCSCSPCQRSRWLSTDETADGTTPSARPSLVPMATLNQRQQAGVDAVTRAAQEPGVPLQQANKCQNGGFTERSPPTACASVSTPPGARACPRLGPGGRPGHPRRSGLPQRHLRGLPPRDGLLPDPHHQGRPLRLPEGALRDPRGLDVVGVVSRIPNASPDQLRSAGDDYPEALTEKYTALPPTGLGRTRALARGLTEGAASPYDAVLRMNGHLREAYPYDLSIPPQRGEMDAV